MKDASKLESSALENTKLCREAAARVGSLKIELDNVRIKLDKMEKAHEKQRKSVSALKIKVTFLFKFFCAVAGAVAASIVDRLFM